MIFWFKLVWFFSLFLPGCVPWVGFGCVCCNMFVTSGLGGVCLGLVVFWVCGVIAGCLVGFRVGVCAIRLVVFLVGWVWDYCW